MFTTPAEVVTPNRACICDMAVPVECAMPVYTFRRTQVVQMPLAGCWRFFSDPRNLEKITPPALRLRVQSELPEEVHPGLMIRYTVTPLLAIRMEWLTEITQVRRPDYFVDEQRVGPYRVWHHEHSFRRLDDARTEVSDLVHYVPPLGPLGAIINALAIRRQLDKIFAFRETQLERLAPGEVL
ncbi:SRPBCC family protein [soil metagenome]